MAISTILPWHIYEWKGSLTVFFVGWVDVSKFLSKPSAYSQPTNTQTSHPIGGLAFNHSRNSSAFERQPTLHRMPTQHRLSSRGA